MIVVSDTTAIISLIKIGCLDILEKLYKSVVIPGAVYDELIINTDHKEETDIIKKCDFLQVNTVEENLSVTLLQKQLGLDLGESEVIVLAGLINADLIIIDERRARRIAKDIGFNITGTLGVLVTAKKRGLVEELKPLLERLIEDNIRISKRLYNDILRMVGEL